MSHSCFLLAFSVGDMGLCYITKVAPDKNIVGELYLRWLAFQVCKSAHRYNKIHTIAARLCKDVNKNKILLKITQEVATKGNSKWDPREKWSRKKRPNMRWKQWEDREGRRRKKSASAAKFVWSLSAARESDWGKTFRQMSIKKTALPLPAVPSLRSILGSLR